MKNVEILKAIKEGTFKQLDYSDATDRLKKSPIQEKCLRKLVEFNLGTNNSQAPQVSNLYDIAIKFGVSIGTVRRLRNNGFMMDPTLYDLLSIFGEHKGYKWYFIVGQLDYLLARDLDNIYRGGGGGDSRALNKRIKLASTGIMDGIQGYSRYPIALVSKDGIPAYSRIFEVGMA
jgi:hypothetical protein